MTPSPGNHAAQPSPSHAAAIKQHAQSLGFDLVGIAPAVSPQGVSRLYEWLERGFAGTMEYMERHATAREHPRGVLDGVRSVIVAAMNYATDNPVPPALLQGRVSRYAWGNDYHAVLRDRL